jgi:hypothetical protein
VLSASGWAGTSAHRPTWVTRDFSTSLTPVEATKRQSGHLLADQLAYPPRTGRRFANPVGPGSEELLTWCLTSQEFSRPVMTDGLRPCHSGYEVTGPRKILTILVCQSVRVVPKSDIATI